MPVVIVPRALVSIFSWLILATAGYLLWSWWSGFHVRDLDGNLVHVRGAAWRLYLGLGLAAWSLLGRFVVLMLTPAGDDEPREERGRSATVSGASGAALNTEVFGPEEGPTVVFTHGWGLNATAWWYSRRALAEKYKVVAWDLPGLGRSKAPPGGRLDLDSFAADLGSVLSSLGTGPFLLVGHSIGGMTTQTFWRTAPPDLRARVAGVVLVDTTHEDPIRTMWLSPLWRALRAPLIEPMCLLTILLWPIAWLSAWQGYLNGSAQLVMRFAGFGRHATRGQVDFSARLAAKGSPAIQAKGNLAMFRWRATDVLPGIKAPVLVLVGDRDIITLPGASAEIASALPDGRLVRIKGAGHNGILECSEVYNAQISAFADACFARAASQETPRRPDRAASPPTT